MTGDSHHSLTIAEAGRLIAAKKLSPVELTKALLARIKAVDPKINAFLTITDRAALTAARAAERAVMAGRKDPLLGIPVAYKDIYETAGVRPRRIRASCNDNIPNHDAETVRRLRAAGTVMLGKLATHEFAIGGPAFDLPWPPARNPWDTRRFTGGSSSGSAAAVAAGLALGALGSDTGGSIRLPAAYCGIAGLKPTPGAGVAPRRHPAGPQPGHRRADGMDRAGLRDPAGRPRRARSGRPGLGARPDAVLRQVHRSAGEGAARRRAAAYLRARHAGLAPSAAGDEPRRGGC